MQTRSRKITILFIIAILLFVSEAGLLLFGWKGLKVELSKSFTEVKEVLVPDENRVYGAIMPHHLIVKDKMKEFLAGLKKYDYQTVVLIGPNHFERGHSSVITSDQSWATDSGDLMPDEKIINGLAKNNLAMVDDATIKGDHSMYNLTPLIKKYFPEANFLPIILSAKTKPGRVDQLADFLANNFDPEKTLVLASVDFSHYQTVAVADWHDEKSQAVIKSFDFNRIYDLEIDSPPSIYAVLKYLEKIGAQKSELVYHTNSGRLAASFDIPTTSHNFYYFRQGEKIEKSLINFLFFGDLMLDRNVGAKIKKNGLESIFNNLAGEENRFFSGVDLISANLEGAVADNGAHYSPEMAYDFSFAPELIEKLKDQYNFNFFNLANNHFSDQGERGIIETKKNLNNLGLYFSGCQDKQVDDCSSKIVQINSDPSSGSGQRKIGMAGFSMVYGQFDREAAKKIVSDLASSTDFAVVNVHWGVEYEHQFNKLQQEIAHELVDAGADMIIGHHPHVVQGMEFYQGKPIFYSLGNFVFDQYFSADTQEGLAVGFNLEDNDLEINLFPLKSKGSQVELMKGDEKVKFLEKLTGWSEVTSEYQTQIKNSKLLFTVY
jgi:poly-gamma-glutamate synthesis protein (capsule biosynthesis protein)